MYWLNLKSVAFPVPEIIAKKIWAVPGYAHAPFSLKFLISPKFPHVPLGVGGWPLGPEERRCWAK